MYKFLGIGAQKAGTSWLYEMLKMHPEISFPYQRQKLQASDSFLYNKEGHYWNRAYPKLAVEDYFAHFQHPTLNEGEITPAYAFLPTAIIKEIHKYQPELKIIYIIRNPIDRAWSSAKMALAMADMEFYEASNQWFIDHFNSKGSLLRGDYETSIRNWRMFFDDQLLVLKFDLIKQAPEEFLSKCCLHLEIKEFNPRQFDLMSLNNAVYSTSERKLNPILKKHLVNLYQEKINKLADYLDFDLSEWMD